MRAAERQAKQLQRRRPAFGPMINGVDFVEVDAKLPRCREELLDLLGREPQIITTQYQRSIVNDQSRQAHIGQRPRANEDFEAVRSALEEILEKRQNCLVRHRLEVVEKERDSPTD